MGVNGYEYEYKDNVLAGDINFLKRKTERHFI
jgi:hypothetical protein